MRRADPVLTERLAVRSRIPGAAGRHHEKETSCLRLARARQAQAVRSLPSPGVLPELEEWLSGPAGRLTHAGLEEQLDARGRELLRLLHQDHLDLRAAREERRAGVTGADSITRTRMGAGHQRGLVTVFGEVTVTRMAYRAPGAANLHPADTELNLPEEKHPHGMRSWRRSSPPAVRSRPPRTPSPAPPGQWRASAKSSSLPGGPPRRGRVLCRPASRPPA